MGYTYNYPRPAVTTDCLVFTRPKKKNHLLLIQRDQAPFKGMWALPGGFVEIEEDITNGAYRELEEETGIRNIILYQFKTFGEVNRDPRGRTISIVYYGIVHPEETSLQAGSDAKSARWFTIDNLPELAFDHNKIINEAIEILPI